MTSEPQNLRSRLMTPRSERLDDARREYMTKVILIILSVVAGLGFLAFIITWAIGRIAPEFPLVTGLATIFFGGGLWLAYRGYWRASSYIPPIVVFLAAVSGNYMEGVKTGAILYYMIAVLLAAMLQGNRTQWITLVLSIGAYTALGWALHYGFLPAMETPPHPFARWTANVNLAFIIISLLIQFFNNQFQRIITQAHTRSVKLAEGQKALEEKTKEVQELAEDDRQAREELERVVAEYGNFTQKVAQGDLREQLIVNASENLGKLGNQLNEMVGSLRELTTQTIEMAQSVATASNEILTATEQQATSAQEQAATTNQLTSMLEEVKTVAEEMATRAQGTADLASQTAQVSQQGTQAVQNTVQGTSDIQRRVSKLAKTILGLSERTQQIGEIIAAVDEIAEQSNMLALNAAVEAARAGEAGRGFAVVAQEVRGLAERSQEATNQVRAIIQGIQRATNDAVLTAEEVSKSVQRGESLTMEAGEVIVELGKLIDQATQAATQIVANAQQQVGGLEQMAGAMGGISDATNQTALSLQQTEKAARDLNALAQQMEQVVKLYRV